MNILDLKKENALRQFKNRDTIYLEDARIISQISHAGDQHIIRVEAPDCAQHATPGTFAHLTCDPAVPMRRPLSIMRANAGEGWVEFLYKPIGRGLANLANRSIGDRISLLGPIGKGFEPAPDRPLIVAIGGGVGIPPVFFLAELLKGKSKTEVLVFMGSEVPFPFELRQADSQIEGISAEISASVATLDNWGVASRLASNTGFPNCFSGYVPDLARLWLSALTADRINQAQIVACGPMPMLAATAALARDFSLPCQVAVEEYMACGVGGCAGCTILVRTPDGPSMKRVCVDGPVFAAEDVFPERDWAAAD